MKTLVEHSYLVYMLLMTNSCVCRTHMVLNENMKPFQGDLTEKETTKHKLTFSTIFVTIAIVTLIANTSKGCHQ